MQMTVDHHPQGPRRARAVVRLLKEESMQMHIIDRPPVLASQGRGPSPLPGTLLIYETAATGKAIELSGLTKEEAAGIRRRSSAFAKRRGLKFRGFYTPSTQTLTCWMEA